ncbi:uncharacterized protein RJT21DRAFT_117673 [Scheffersomyces amazonensis]|uniref:uncharacterized protein n=1 Tax=Scheffersomyces amazonensis TaxID=1078765 RepID=UPI00315C798E
MTSTTENYYSLLEISPSATAEEIKKSFKKLSLKYHPDKTKNKEYHDRFISINEAYDTLKDPEKKRVYDLSFPTTSNQYAYSTTTTSSSTYPSYTPANSFNSFTTTYSRFSNFYNRKQDAKSQEENNRAKQEAEKLRRSMLAEQRRQEEERRRKQREEEENLRRRILEEEIRHREREEERRRQQREGSQHILNKLNNLPKTARKNELEDLLDKFEKKEAGMKGNKFDKTSTERVLRERVNDGDKGYHESKKFAQRRVRINQSKDFITPDEFDEIYKSTKAGQREEARKLREVSDELKARDNSSSREASVGAAENGKDLNSSRSKSPEHIIEDESSPLKGNTGSSETNVAEEDEEDDDYFEEYVPGNPPTLHGQDSTDPIVLDDEEAAMEANAKRNKAKLGSSEEDKEDSDREYKKRGTSPIRVSITKQQQDFIPLDETSRNSSKRPKTSGTTFSYNEIHKTLEGQNIDDTDFTEMINNLPNTNNGRRKPSAEISTASSKRAKVAEYYDGSSRAETLSTPINRNTVRGYNPSVEPSPKKPLTVFDLHASPSIFECKPPATPSAVINPAISRSGWKSYVKKMQRYHRDFLQYKKLVIQYQLERVAKDEELFEEINDEVNSEVYHQCLRRDLQVNQEYTEQLRIFTNVMTIYKQNCGWMNIRHKDQGW